MGVARCGMRRLAPRLLAIPPESLSLPDARRAAAADSQDLGCLVSEQGEHIDNIQTNVEQSQRYVERGNKELLVANRSQKRAGSRLCCLSVIISILLVVLLITLKSMHLI